VCDYRMPGKTGIDLLTELRGKRSSVPGRKHFAYADALVEAAIVELGSVDWLEEPIRSRRLIEEAAEVEQGKYDGTCHSQRDPCNNSAQGGAASGPIGGTGRVDCARCHP